MTVNQPSATLLCHANAVQKNITKPDAAAIHVVEEIIRKHGEIGIICVSGARDRDKCILLNYFIRYLHWLSHPDDGKAPIFVREGLGLHKKGVFIWPQIFHVHVGRQSGSIRDKVALLLVDVSRDEEWSGGVCIHLIKGNIKSSQTFVDRMKEAISEWDQLAEKRKSLVSREVHLIRDWEFIHKPDWRTIIRQFKSREDFRTPPSYKDIHIVSEYLMTLVYHTFGDLCGDDGNHSQLMSKRTFHNVSCDSKEECVVEKVVQQYVQSSRQRMDKLLSDPTTSQQSLLTMHNSLLNQAIEEIRNIRSPAQVTLQRIQLLNKRLRDEFERLKEDYKKLKENRKAELLSSLHGKYATAMEDALTKLKAVEDQDLCSLHQTEMRKCLAEFRSKITLGESELQERINQTFQKLKAQNTSTRTAMHSSLNTLIEEQLKPFVDQMETFMCQTLDIDLQAINTRFWSIKANSLRSFEAALKALSPTPAIMRKMKKDFEGAMDQKKIRMVAERRQFLQVLSHQMNETFLLYNKRMHHEMDTEPYMDREAAVRVHHKLVDELIQDWPDELCRSMLRKMMQEQFDNLWIELQKVNTERGERLKQLVPNLHRKYQVHIGVILADEKRRPASADQLTKFHYDILKTIEDVYNKDPDIKQVGRHVMHVEKELRLVIADSFEEIRAVFKGHIDRQIEELVESCRNFYVKSLGKECSDHPPHSLVDLKNKHLKLMRQQMTFLEADARVKGSRDKDKYKEQLKSLIEEEYGKKEAEVGLELAEQAKKKELEDKVQQAKAEAFQYFVTETRDHLTKMKNVTESDVGNAHFEIRKECLALYRSSVPDDAPEDMKDVAQNELNLLLNDEFDLQVETFVEGKKDGAVKSAAKRLGNALVSLVTMSFKSEEQKPLTPKKSYATVACRASSLPDPPSQQDPESMEDMVARYVQSYATQVRNFIDQNPYACFTLRSAEHVKVANKLEREMRKKGVPDHEVLSARRKMDKAWRAMRFMNTEKASKM